MTDRKHEFYFWLAIFVVVLIVVVPIWWQARKDHEFLQQLSQTWEEDHRKEYHSVQEVVGMMDQVLDTLAVWLDTNNTVLDTLEILDDARWKQIEENFLLSK